MKKEYFVQYSDQSIINSFDFPKDNFVSITVGISEITHDLITSLVQKMFHFPVFFVLESMIFGYEKETLIENKVPFYEFSSDGAIIKVDSAEKLGHVSGLAEVLVNNGLSIFIFYGEGIVEQDLIPSRQWNKPIEFKNVDIDKVDTFVDVEEVGFTIFSKSNLFNTRFTEERYEELIEKALHEFSRRQSSHLLIDLTGMNQFDEFTIYGLERLISSIGLLGGECTLVGVSPSLSIQITKSEINLNTLTSFSTLQQSVQYALEQSGFEIVKKKKRNTL